MALLAPRRLVATLSPLLLLLAASGCARLEARSDAPAGAPSSDWCAGHDVPESAWTICNPSLVEQFKAAGDWCAGHDLPESVCPTCNGGPVRSAVTSTATPAPSSDWCAGHDVPESACTICNPSLVEQFKAAGDWCAGHDLPESVCPTCNGGPVRSAVTSTATPAPSSDWCAGHDVPESACTICNPALVEQFKAAGDWCAGHDLPESVCPTCNGGPVREAATTPARTTSTATPAPSSDWCAGHGVPESACTICNPSLVEQFKAAGDWCAGHDLPESVCPTCNGGPVREAAAAPPVATGGVADWCGGHGLPESACTKCDPSLVGRFKAAGDWCAEHDFPESACPTCNPQVPPAGAITADWCLEHAQPESRCAKCNAALVPELKASGDWCAEHGFAESVCPICNPVAPPPGAEEATIEARVVRFLSPDLEDRVGLRTVTARRLTHAPTVECTARLAFDADRVADVRSLVPGVVRAVHAKLGQRVEVGDALFDLESVSVGRTQGELAAARQHERTARANVERLRELERKGIASTRSVEVAEQELAAAEAEVRSARASLRMTGAASGDSEGRFTLRAPIAGTVVHRPAMLGTLATADDSLATLADSSVVWALCDVAEEDAAAIAPGQPMTVTVAGGAGAGLSGPITWIASEVDPRTRTVTTRAEIANPAGRLRANQFASAVIETQPPRDALAVPREAVQRVLGREVVFVRTAPGVHEPRVVTRHGGGRVVPVEGRLREGDEVVTTGAVLLRTEILPGSIGAGCCEVGPREDG